jgi:uncharacterized membrane protein
VRGLRRIDFAQRDDIMTTQNRRASRFGTWASVLALLVALFGAPAAALAGPRSGGSFGGRLGFRSGGGFSAPRSYGPGYGSGYGSGYGYGGGPRFFFFPGWGGFGYGGGMFGSVFTLLAVGAAVYAIARVVRASRAASGGQTQWGYEGDDGQPVAMPGRAYLYKLQLALGRSARGVQDRLAEFAAQGDTATEAGLAALLQQTSLELLREADAIRYAAAEARGPMTLTNAETAMNGMALSERSRFTIERVRAADGRAIRSAAVAEEGKEALELVVVTLIVATRTPLERFAAIAAHEQLKALLAELGGVSPDGLLGLEVVWTPADPNDSMTETDVMTTYPELRSL